MFLVASKILVSVKNLENPSGYSLIVLFTTYILLLFTTYVSSDTHMHINVVAYITVIFWIKLKLKMPISPTSGA